MKKLDSRNRHKGCPQNIFHIEQDEVSSTSRSAWRAAVHAVPSSTHKNWQYDGNMATWCHFYPWGLSKKAWRCQRRKRFNFDSHGRIAVCIVKLLAILLMWQPYDGKQRKDVLDGVFVGMFCCMYRNFAPRIYPHMSWMCIAVAGGMFNAYLSYLPRIGNA